MPVIWIPSLLRDLTGGQDRVCLPGKTVGEMIDALDQQYPGIKERLVVQGKLRPSLALTIDGEVSHQHLRAIVGENSEIHFLPAISGG